MTSSDKIALVSAVIAGMAFVAAVFSCVWAVKQTRIAREAVATSERANQLSAEANTTAAQALTVSELGALDARKARLATAAPQLAVTPGQVEWPPLRQAVAAWSPGSSWPSDYIFRTPRDENVLLGLRYTLTIRNIGTDTEFMLHGSIAPTDPLFVANATLGTRVELAAGESVTVTLEQYEPLHRWIDDHQTRRAGGPGKYDLRSWISCSDGRDEGIIGIINGFVALLGLEYIEEETGSWRFTNAHAALPGQQWPPTRPWVAPMELKYYESKINDRPLQA
ncbi:hypothetical protein GCM10009759_15210 [Kitasatospora saccharophila]|uniref:Uncharacterized protein n=1 Tax=Kitasatospora saccharophila TaxID=407973 RepID=A0ABN2WH23_9ACTN